MEENKFLSFLSDKNKASDHSCDQRLCAFGRYIYLACLVDGNDEKISCLFRAKGFVFNRGAKIGAM